MMLVMTNRPELRPSLLLLIMSSLVISDNLPNTEIPSTQHMTASRSSQEHSTDIQSTGGPGLSHTTTQKFNLSSLTTAHSAEGSETSRSLHPARTAGSENATGSESPLQTEPPVSNSTSTSSSGSSARTLGASVEPREGTHKQATSAVVAIATTSHGPLIDRNTTRPAISHGAEIGTSATTKQASTKPQSSQTRGKTTTTTTTTTGVKKDHICSTEAPKREGVVGRCLIAIALLAGLATIFIASTIILATKLAGSRYRHKMRLLQETEMVCISALMNDTEHPMPKQRHPKSNGALIPSTEDEDGDDLTLNSFLPDTECVA
ncbi:P-selectin glycoprotein ligand 1 [Salminus brasiliensis]|uniref:P-selectin glycoprotein ligand 1 n=1 Tax=Salminus brasiliensis TaxID=930266 RepID=UPI003B839CCE